MDFLEESRRRATQRLQSMQDAAPTLSVPIHDTAESAPGWRFILERYSCVPDAYYPWDPDVMRAIVGLCPDAVPITIRSVWRSSRLDGTPYDMVIVRHGIARSIRDPIAPVHHFYCEMPSTPVSGRVRLSKPNYIELNWYDKQVRPWGFDLPGEYLPFDWELYYALARGRTGGRNLSASELRERLMSPYEAREKLRKEHAQKEAEDRNTDIQEYTSRRLERASDVEKKEAAGEQMAKILDPPQYEPKPQILVP